MVANRRSILKLSIVVFIGLITLEIIPGCMRSTMPPPVNLEINRGYGYTKRASWKIAEEAELKKINPDAIFIIKDKADDDRGPGSYQYPLRGEFVQGVFDIRKFEVIPGEKQIEFRVTMQREIARSLLSRIGEGLWLHQIIDIYVDTDRVSGSGELKALPGRDVRFEAAFAWDKAILVVPENESDMKRTLRDKSELIGFGSYELDQRIMLPTSVDVNGWTFVIKVPKGLLGEPTKDWAYQVLMMAYEEFDRPDTLKNKKINSFATEQGFGGGSDYSGSPNVLDMLVPKGLDQYRILGKYISHPDPAQSQMAFIPMVTSVDADTEK